MDAPGGLAAIGEDHACRAERVDVLVIPFAIELRIGQDAHFWVTGCAASIIGCRVALSLYGPRRASGVTSAWVSTSPDDQPLEPVRPRARCLATVFARAPIEKLTHRACGEPRTIDRDGRARTSGVLQLLRDHAYGGPERRLIDSTQESIERRVVRHEAQSTGPAEFPMLPQAHLSFAKGPVLVAHDAEQGEEVGLRERMLLELAAIAGQHRTRGRHRMTRERDPADFEHPSSGLSRLDSATT